MEEQGPSGSLAWEIFTESMGDRINWETITPVMEDRMRRAVLAVEQNVQPVVQEHVHRWMYRGHELEEQGGLVQLSSGSKYKTLVLQGCSGQGGCGSLQVAALAGKWDMKALDMLGIAGVTA